MVFHDAVVLKLDDASYVYGELRVESFLVTRFRDILAPLALLENGQIGTSCDRCFKVNPTSVYGSSDATPTLGVSPQTGHQLTECAKAAATLQGEKGFRTSAEDTRSGELKSVFVARAELRIDVTFAMARS